MTEPLKLPGLPAFLSLSSILIFSSEEFSKFLMQQLLAISYKKDTAVLTAEIHGKPV